MSDKTTHYYEFDAYRVDLTQKCLLSGDELVSLTPKAFETLVVLVENRGKIVSKDELLNKVWADTFVEESTLTQNISTLRRTLAGQKDGKQFIETIPRRGYRFVEDVREIFGDEELMVVETLRRTHIVAEQTTQEQNLDASQTIVKTGQNSAISPKQTFLQKNRFLLAFIGIIGVVLLIGTILAIRYFYPATSSFEEKFDKIQMTKLTSSGNIYRMAISSDGKYLAMVEKKSELQTLLLKQTDNGNTIEIIPPTKDNFIGITMSPDNRFIYYSVYENIEQKNQSTKIGVLSKIPALGGVRTEILKDIDSPPALSPDGTKFAFVRQYPSERQSALMIYDSAAAENKEIRLANRSLNESFSLEGLSWSPDGKNIASAAVNKNDEDETFEIVVTNVESGQQKTVTSKSLTWIGQVSWLNDNSGIVFTAFNRDSPNMTDEIWFVSYPQVKFKNITNGINGFYGVGTTGDTQSIVTVRSNRVSSLWISSTDDAESAAAIDKSIGDDSLVNLGMDWTPDEKIVFASAQNGNADIWIINSDGTNLKQLTDTPNAELNPVNTSDGKYVVFVSNRNGIQSLWRMNIDGANSKQLVSLRDITSISISPDGSFVFFSANKNQNTTNYLWKIPIEGGEPVQITDALTLFPQVSPDGKYIACYFPQKNEKGANSGELKLTILSAHDGSIAKQFDKSFAATEISLLWTPDGKAVSYSTFKNGVSNIWLQSLDESSPRKIMNLPSDEIFRYSWSKDGKKVAYEKGMKINDLIIIHPMNESPK